MTKEENKQATKMNAYHFESHQVNLSFEIIIGIIFISFHF